MKYRCIPCDHEFELEGNAKPRCPRCMTIHDLEPVAASASKPPARGKHKYLGAVALLGVLALGLLAMLLTRGESEEQARSMGPGSSGGIESRLAELSADLERVVDPCAPDDAVRKWVEPLSPGKGVQAVEQLHAALLKAKEQSRWRPHPQREPRLEPPLTAGELASRLFLEPPQSPYEALSYELSCLLLAAGRAAHGSVRLVEVLEFEGTEAPADPEGRLGRYAVEVGEGSEAFLLDPYSGRSKASAKGRFVALDRVQEAAPYYGIGALSKLVARQTPEALKLNDAAIALDGRSGWLRMGRGLIIAATGAIEEAMNELERAVKTQEEPPLLVGLAEVQLLVDASGRSARASLVAALAKNPKYARAKALLGMTHLLSGEEDMAKTDLEEAERLDPDSASIKLLVARYLMVKSDIEGAIAKGKEAVRISGSTPAALLGLAGIYGGAARFDEMRATLDELLAKVDSPAMAEEITRMFGYEPKRLADAETDPEQENYQADAGAGDGALQLKLDPMGGGGRASRYGFGDAGGGLDLKLDMGSH
jgi:tetratricopeptide (TPR) repeat protein